MIGLWIWRAALAVLAPIVVFAQLDRASYDRPEVFVFVPSPFRNFAQTPAALLALTAGEPDEALAEAQKLVRRRPMPAEHIFALAMAELQAGRPRAFASAFRVASTRGWRFTPLQVAAAQAAIDNRDAPGAAKRVAALWAAEAGHPSLPLLTRQLLELSGGPEAFGSALAGSRSWRNQFLARAGEVTAPQLAMRSVLAAQRAGARFECSSLERFRTWLKSQGQEAPRSLVCQ